MTQVDINNGENVHNQTPPLHPNFPSQNASKDTLNSAQNSSLKAQWHWQKTRKLALILCLIWLIPTFGVIFFARELSHLTIGNWPISFYMAAQGLTLLYVAIVGIHAYLMNQASKHEKNRLQTSNDPKNNAS